MTDPATYPNQGVLSRGRMRFERDFTQLPNAWLRDRRLSRAARGLLGELMSHDAGFDVSIQSLQALGVEGKDAIRRMVTELEQTGYLLRSKQRRKGMFGGYVWQLQDPFEGVDNSGSVTLPGLENPRSDRGGFSDDGLTDDGLTDDGLTAAVNPTTKEDQFKNNKPPVPEVTTETPVDNFVRQGSHGACGHRLIDTHWCERGCSRAAVLGQAVGS